MIARGTDKAAIVKAAKQTGVELYNLRPIGKGFAFRLWLKTGSEKYRRRSYTGRRIAAVCWHGHRDFYRALFALAPTARVQSAFMRANAPGERYYTAENFEGLYRYTGGRNIGSLMQPMIMADACDCGEGVQ